MDTCLATRDRFKAYLDYFEAYVDLMMQGPLKNACDININSADSVAFRIEKCYN